MNTFYEYSDILNSPIEAFYCEAPKFHLPVETHWHYFVEILYVFRGTITITCNEHTFSLKEGSMLLLPPQAIHSIYKSDESNDFYYACVKFNINRIQYMESYLPNLNSELRKMAQLLAPPLLFQDKDFPNITLSDFFHDMVREAQNQYYGYNSYLYSRVSDLLLLIIRHWYYKGFLAPSHSLVESDEYSIHKALIYIDEHSHENINIEQLAHICNMSYSYFAKIFHRQYGQSCKQYIEMIRLAKVEQLLLFTEMDLSTIASETGFADCSHLIRSFKRRYKITPKQFRLARQGKIPG